MKPAYDGSFIKSQARKDVFLIYELLLGKYVLRSGRHLCLLLVTSQRKQILIIMTMIYIFNVTITSILLCIDLSALGDLQAHPYTVVL